MDSSRQCPSRFQTVWFMLTLVATCVLPASAHSGDSLNKAIEEATSSITESLVLPPEHDVIRVSRLLDLPNGDDKTGEHPEANQDFSPESRGEGDAMELPDSKPRDATSDDDSDSKADDKDGDEPQSDRNSDDRMTHDQDGRFVLPALRAPSIATASIGNGSLPKGFRTLRPDTPRLLPESGQERQLDNHPWAWSIANWSAANTFSHPRYFEDRVLERHGHERFPAIQPLCSGARFFATVPMLPYLMTLSEPCSSESTLGYFRSGSCTASYRQRPPYSQRAVVAEAAAITTGVLVFP